MSNSNLPVSRQRWFSVGIRYFSPIYGGKCAIFSCTVRANDERDAQQKAGAMFSRAIFYEPLSEEYYLPDGTLVEPWCQTDAVEIPPARALLLDEELFR